MFDERVNQYVVKVWTHIRISTAMTWKRISSVYKMVCFKAISSRPPHRIWNTPLFYRCTYYVISSHLRERLDSLKLLFMGKETVVVCLTEFDFVYETQTQGNWKSEEGGFARIRFTGVVKKACKYQIVCIIFSPFLRAVLFIATPWTRRLRNHCRGKTKLTIRFHLQFNQTKFENRFWMT